MLIIDDGKATAKHTLNTPKLSFHLKLDLSERLQTPVEMMVIKTWSSWQRAAPIPIMKRLPLAALFQQPAVLGEKKGVKPTPNKPPQQKNPTQSIEVWRTGISETLLSSYSSLVPLCPAEAQQQESWDSSSSPLLLFGNLEVT